MGAAQALPPTLACAPTASGDSGCGCALCVPAGEGQEGHGEGSQLAIEGPAQRAGGAVAHIWGSEALDTQPDFASLGGMSTLPGVPKVCGGVCQTAPMSPQGPAVMSSSDRNLPSVALSLPSHWGCLEGGALSSPSDYRHPKAGPRLHSKFLATWGLGLHHLYPTLRWEMRCCF